MRYFLKTILMITGGIILFSCNKQQSEKPTDEYVINTFYDESENQLEKRIIVSNNNIRSINAYSRNDILIDSLVRVENKIHIQKVQDELYLGDTATFLLKFKNPQFDNQYLLLSDSIIPNNLLDYDNLIQSSNGIEVEIKFVCKNVGENKVSGILFNTSIEVIDYINENDFIGRRVGIFEGFRIYFTVEGRKNTINKAIF